MAKRKKQTGDTPARRERAKLSPEESLKRMQEFHKRKEPLIASVRKGKNRGVST